MIGASLEKTKGFKPLSKWRLFDDYIEGRSRLVCYLDMVHRGANRSCVITLAYIERAILIDIPIPVTETKSETSYSLGSEKQPMLVDVAQLVEYPEGFSGTTLVGLHLVYDGILNGCGGASEATLRPDLTGEAFCIVGEWEPGIFSISRNGIDKPSHDIIKTGSQVSNSISKDDFRVSVEIMKRLKFVFQTVPLIRLDRQSVVICVEPAIDPSVKVRNVIACAS